MQNPSLQKTAIAESVHLPIATSQAISVPISQIPSTSHQSAIVDSTHPHSTKAREQIGRSDDVFRFRSSPTRAKSRKSKRVNAKDDNKRERNMTKPSDPAKRSSNQDYDTWGKKSKAILDSGDEDVGDDVVFAPNPSSASQGDIAVEICKLCKAQFNEKKTLIRHIKNVHGADETYKQFDAQGVKRKTFASVEQTKNVKRQPQYLYKCSLCSFLFVKEISLHRHVKNVHGVEPQGEKRKLDNFACLLCSNVYKSQKALDNHTTSHQKSVKRSNNFPCTNCSEIFKSKKTLNNHLSSAHRQDVKNSNSNYDSWK